MSSLSNDFLVIDANIGWRLFTPHPDQARLDQQLTIARTAGIRLVAPTLWRYEVTTILTKALYFKQLTIDEVEAAMRLSGRFDIDLLPPDANLAAAALAWTVRLRRAAAYDSFYLALAQRLACELWTVDHKLFNAVGVPWVRYVGSATEESPS